MWYCRKCGTENYQNSNYCQKCGTPKDSVKKPVDLKVPIIASCAIIIIALSVWIIKLRSDSVKPITTPVYTAPVYTASPTLIPTSRPIETPIATRLPSPTPIITARPTTNPQDIPRLSIKNATYPVDEILQYGIWDLCGEISTDKGVIAMVRGRIVDRNNNVIQESTFYPYESSFNLTGTINAGLVFGTLNVGNYRYILSAIAEYNSCSSGEVILIDRAFSIVPQAE